MHVGTSSTSIGDILRGGGGGVAEGLPLLEALDYALTVVVSAIVLAASSALALATSAIMAFFDWAVSERRFCLLELAGDGLLSLFVLRRRSLDLSRFRSRLRSLFAAACMASG